MSLLDLCTDLLATIIVTSYNLSNYLTLKVVEVLTEESKHG